MRHAFNVINYDRIVYLVKMKFTKERDFCKSLWGKDTHLNLKYFQERPDTQASTLVKMSELLDIPIDLFFQESDVDPNFPSFVGNNNIVNSTNVNNDPVHLAAENKALKMVIEELKKQNERLGETLNLALKVGLKSDK